jgi:hypothetical protein
MAKQSKKSRWDIEDYAAVVTFSGAEKLADSQVAPLVAQARGYSTVTDDEGARAVAKATYTAEERKVTTRLKSMVKGGNDFMVIPWFRASTVIRDGANAQSSTTQVRPAEPLPNAKGKPAKYEMLSGHSSAVDVNPGTPAEWFEKATRFLVTEGCLKGDAAVSAQLLAAGFTHSELAAVGGATAEDARARLQTLMLRVPVRDRIPVLSFIGVGNWHHNPEWNSIVFRDRDVLIAFDGDLRDNRMVWGQTDKMWKFVEEAKSGTPKLLDLGGPNAEKDKAVAGYPAGKKVGLDDYLSYVGSWADLLKLVEDNLPQQPEKADADAKPGEFRVSADGMSVLEYVKQESSEAFGGVSYSWETRVPIGGRVKLVTSLRTLTDVEVRDGFIRPGAVIDSPRGECTIELTWTDDLTGEPVTREVVGPHVIMETPPAEWTRRGARVHRDIRRHPAWPPRNKAGDGFLSAIKAHKIAEQDLLDGWDTMGYVPSTSGNPVFVVGEQALGASREDEKENRPGVTEEIMPMATKYGVNDTYWGFYDDNDIEGWKAQIREDIRTVGDAFITDPAWRLPAVGPTVLACALRPTAPGRTSINLYITGAPGTGKTHMASFIMSFWGCRPGTWTVTGLPGSANDTPAAREHTVARTPLHVIDDLAPNVSRQVSERQESGVDEAIRSGFNGHPKRRGTADGDQRQVSHPRALVVYTAENQRDTLSIRQRMIGIHLASKRDINSSPVDRPKYIEDLGKRPDNPLARLTAAMIRFWLNVDVAQTPLPMLRRDAQPENLDTWKGKHEFAQNAISATKVLIQKQLKARYGIDHGTSARRAGMFAELFFTLDVIQALGLWAGLPASDPAMKPFFAGPNDIGQLRGAMIDLAAQDLNEFRASSNSRNLLEAIRNLLAAGRAHLEHPTLSGSRPVLSGDNADYYNRAAGWRVDPRSDQWVPNGIPIGHLGVPTDSEDPSDFVALLSSANAFNLAQREHPKLVPPGQKAGDTWNQVWEDEDGAMVHPGYKRPSSGREYTTKARLAGNTPPNDETAPAVPPRVGRLRGVPVKFSEIVPPPETD